MPLLILTVAVLLGTSASLSAQTTDAYVDSAARVWVQKARERRQIADVSVERYKALSKERISVGLRGLRRDRLVYRRETVGRIEWAREGQGRIEVLGAREMVPVAIKGVQLPNDLTSFMPHLAFDPADNRMLLGWDDEGFVRHPLAPDAEEHYRFRSGSTTSIQLQDGSVIRLLELEIIPRRSDPHLISGSFWLEAQTYAVVQAGFRLARRIDILRDLEDEEDDDDDVPGFLRNMTAELDYVTIDYGLYNLRWWMPRLIAFEGVVRVGPFRMPLLYERSYSEYTIEGVDQPVAISMAEMMQRDSVRAAQEEKCDGQMDVTVRIGEKEADSSARPRAERLSGNCGRWEVVMVNDTAALLNSELLPDDPFSSDEQLVTETELEDLIKERLEGLPRVPSMIGAPELQFSLFDPNLLRYNRIEGLSVGTSASADFGAYIVRGSARIGVADLEPNFTFGIEKPGQNMNLFLTGYRRLNGTDPLRTPFTIGNSMSALIFGRDEADFYRTLGVELRGEPAGTSGGRYWWRIYAQQERVAEVETQFSLRHLIKDDYRFRPNIIADENDAVGAEGVLRFNRGLNPTGFRFGTELYGHGATGNFGFGRAALTLRFGIPLPGPFDMATEYAAGSSVDSVPLQHLWYIGGAGTLRGYNAAVMTGNSFWRGRGEISYGLPAVRIVGFSDVGWAGDRDDVSTSKPLLSVGAGVSFLDGIVRFDIARGLREPKGWAATLYFDAAL
jgi:hypothetical protein